MGGQITIQIVPSDDAFGVFSFTTSSLVQVVEEAPSAEVTFTIQRTGGVLGAVLVHWEATQFAEDVSPPSGNVSFERDQTENSFSVTVLEDQVRQNLHLGIHTFSCKIVATRISRGCHNCSDICHWRWKAKQLRKY